MQESSDVDVRKVALLVGALIVAAITAIMAKGLFDTAGAPATAAAAAPAQLDGPQVLVATRALPVGTILQSDSFRYQPWPKELVQEAYYIKDEVPPPQPGTVVRYAITAGQPITQGALVKPGDRGFLAAALGPGMRAVTIPVDAKSGVAGFVFPGDRIDLMLTQSVEGQGPALKTAETFVRNVRVLATDQRTDSQTKDGKTEVVTFSTVTLEATPRIAEKIALAKSFGELSISLRSIADNQAELERAIAAGEVSVGDGKDAKAERQILLAVASRPVDSDTTFVTGADVSRFQRRTMPRQADAASAAATGAPAASSDPSKPTGPVIKVARGNAVTDVPVKDR
jgi:pilus assembly protein CpaB